ncbi:MAG: ATP synthase F1 subunit epsilon [Leptonema sp. (in: bacteria)]
MSIQVSLVTPYKPYYEGSAESVILPLYDGLAGILKNHVDMIAKLGSGKLIIDTKEEKNIFFIDGGFLEISKNKVVILATEAFKKDELNIVDVEKQYSEVLKIIPKNDEQIEDKNNKLQSLRNKIKFIKS